jgi:hypothetical protein
MLEVFRVCDIGWAHWVSLRCSAYMHVGKNRSSGAPESLLRVKAEGCPKYYLRWIYACESGAADSLFPRFLPESRVRRHKAATTTICMIKEKYTRVIDSVDNDWSIKSLDLGGVLVGKATANERVYSKISSIIRTKT